MAPVPTGLRNRLDYRPGKHRPKTVRTGAIAVALTSIFLYTLYTRPSVPFLSGGGTELTAEFSAGTNVRPGYTPVRVHGVEVGQVTKIARAPSGKGAIVTMKLDKGEDVKLKQDVRLALRWRTLLGRNIYVDIDPGSPSAPAWAGGTVPRTRTEDQVELDSALEPLDAKGRQALQTMITEFDKGFADPAAVRAAIGSARSAPKGAASTSQATSGQATGAQGTLEAAAAGLPGLRGENAGDLPKLVANASRFLGELSRDEVALGGLVTKGAGALGVTAARRADLSATLRTTPGTLRDTRTTLKRLEVTLDEVDPLADKLRPGLDRLAGTAASTQRTLTVLRPLLSDLRPTLSSLRPALTDLRTASKAGIPAFTPLNHTMQLVEDKVLPFLKAKDPATKRPNYQNIGPVASHAGSATSWGDRYGAVANFEATAGEDVLDLPGCKLELFNPDVKTADKIKCDLFSLAAASALTGKDPQAFTLKNAAVPLATLRKYIEGNSLLKFPKPLPALPKFLTTPLKGR
ncbi:MAG: Virulence factor Mce family protein [Solirubrobacterales bacterium]|nr:Virulence factor Mce family protein [Solirubrobacterales bacterium]